MMNSKLYGANKLLVWIDIDLKLQTSNSVKVKGYNQENK